MATTAAQSMSRLLPQPKSISISSTTSLLSPKTLPSTVLSYSSSSFLLSPKLCHRLRPLKFSTTAASTPKISTAISIVDKLREATFGYFYPTDKVETVTVSDLTKNKKAIFFAIAGAVIPTYSQKHLPRFVEKAAELKAKGVDTITCISVNDAFMMKAWKKNFNIGDEVMLLNDDNGTFTKAIGCKLDLSDKPVGLGVRERHWGVVSGGNDLGVVIPINDTQPNFVIPDGLRSITTLEVLDTTGVSKELKNRLREGGADFYKIQHVPSVSIY